MKTRNLALVGGVICLFAAQAYAAQIQYTFDISNGLFSENRQLLEDITGLTATEAGAGWFVADSGVMGSLTYDNAGALIGPNGLGGTMYSATVTMQSTLVVNGSSIGTISADNGPTIVDDRPEGDLLNVAISNASANWSGFSVGQYQIVTGGAIWTRGDFLSDETLPEMLPPPPGYELAIFNFGVVDTVNSPSMAQGISAVGLVITVVPIPAAAWLFASALALLGWLRRIAV